MRGYRHRWRLPLPRTASTWVLAVALLAGIGSLLTARAAVPVVRAVAQMKAQQVALELINGVVMQTVGDGLTYQDLVDIRTDAQGRVTLLQTNAMAARRVAATATQSIQEALQRLEDRRHGIPVGQLLGGWLVADIGPHIPLTFRPVGAVNIGLDNRFEEAGINQTRHVVSLAVRVRVQVVLPMLTDEIVVTDRLPLSEAIIVGPVPNSYWRSDGGSGAGRVVPAGDDPVEVIPARP